jgi:uracil-DNA glycosylase family 4
MIVNTVGTPGANIMLVGEAPGEQENRTGKPFHPGTPTGITLDKILSGAGISRHDCLITNVAREKPPGGKIAFYFKDAKCTIPKDILLQDIEKLKKDIRVFKPNIIITLGKVATQILTGNNSITAARGYICESTLLPGVKVLPTYHPQKINYEWKLFFTAVLDIRKAIKNSESPDILKDDRTLITNMSKLEYISYLNYLLYEHKEPIAVDIETLQPGSHIDIMGIADTPTHGVAFELIKGRKAVYSESKELEIWRHLSQVLKTKELIMQNGSYDTTVLYLHHGIYCPKFYYDTMVAAHVCWPENPRSLAYLASICLNVPAWKHTSQTESLLYNAGDTTNTYGIWEVLKRELEKQEVNHIFKHEMAQIEPSVMLQIQGLQVNADKQKELLKGIEQKLVKIKAVLTEELQREVIFKADKKKKDALNINSPTQLAKLLYVDLGIPPQYKRRKSVSESRKLTTDEEALSKLARTIDNPIFNNIIKVKKLSKLKTFIDITTSPEGKVHTSYNVTGATMIRENKGLIIDEEDSFKSFGRWSSSKSIILPYGSGNLQNIPKEARKMYTAPEGYEYLQADYMQAEAVVVAYEINDYREIKLFKESFGLSKEERKERDLDVHKLKASTVFGIPISEVTSDMRKIGKTIKHACVDKDTEVLTEKGWKEIQFLDVEKDKVAQWDKENKITFTKPLKVFKYKYKGNLLRFKKSYFSQTVTKNHRFPIWNRKAKKFKVVLSQDLFRANNGDYSLPISGYFNGSINITPEIIRLFTALQADGSIRERLRHGKEISFMFKKVRKIERLKVLLNNCKIRYSTYETTEKRTGFYLNKEDSAELFNFAVKTKKKFDSWILQLSQDCLNALVDEARWWDARRNKGNNSYQYYSVDRTNCEWLQTAAHLTGRRATIYNNHPTVFTTNVSDAILLTGTEKAKKVTVPYNDYVYSLNVPSTYYLVRKDGLISITGNSNYNAGPGVLAHFLQISLKEAKILMSQAKNATPQLHLWHKRIQQHLQRERSLTNLFGRKHRFLGRYNDNLLRSAYAYTPQSTVGDLLNMALTRFYYKYGMERRIRLQLHDAIYVFSPLGKRQETIAMLKDAMLIELTSSNGVKYTVDVDFSAGPNWGEMEEL